MLVFLNDIHTYYETVYSAVGIANVTLPLFTKKWFPEYETDFTWCWVLIPLTFAWENDPRQCSLIAIVHNYVDYWQSGVVSSNGLYFKYYRGIHLVNWKWSQRTEILTSCTPNGIDLNKSSDQSEIISQHFIWTYYTVYFSYQIYESTGIYEKSHYTSICSESSEK